MIGMNRNLHVHHVHLQHDHVHIPPAAAIRIQMHPSKGLQICKKKKKEVDIPCNICSFVREYILISARVTFFNLHLINLINVACVVDL